MYFLKRGETVVGPYDEATIQKLFDTQKLNPNDLVSENREGPWLLLAQSGIVASLLAPTVGSRVSYAGQASRRAKAIEQKRALANSDASRTRRDVLYILGSVVGIFIFVGIVITFAGFMWFWVPKTKTVQLQVGKATLTVKKTGWNHVKVVCNNGLVAEADWRPNNENDFGYDIAEPKVNQSTNRLSVMLLLRGVIANYMKGEYD